MRGTSIVDLFPFQKHSEKLKKPQGKDTIDTMTKTAAFLVLVLLWVAPFAHAQPNSSNIVDTGADAIGAGANITDNTIDTGIAAAGNLTSTDVGSCLRAIGDAWTCETKPGCTCFSNATG